MFYRKLRNDAIGIYEKAEKQYNNVREDLSRRTEILYSNRIKSCEDIRKYSEFINSLANTPKEFEQTIGKVVVELNTFESSQKYSYDQYKDIFVESFATIAGIHGINSLVNVFGKNKTEKALNGISQVTFKYGIGRASKEVLKKHLLSAGSKYALSAVPAITLGPLMGGVELIIGGVSIIGVSQNNKKTADKVYEEARKITASRKVLEEIMMILIEKNDNEVKMKQDMERFYDSIKDYKNANYVNLREDVQIKLGTFVNNLCTFSVMINETIEKKESKKIIDPNSVEKFVITNSQYELRIWAKWINKKLISFLKKYKDEEESKIKIYIDNCLNDFQPIIEETGNLENLFEIRNSILKNVGSECIFIEITEIVKIC